MHTPMHTLAHSHAHTHTHRQPESPVGARDHLPAQQLSVGAEGRPVPTALARAPSTRQTRTTEQAGLSEQQAHGGATEGPPFPSTGRHTLAPSHRGTFHSPGVRRGARSEVFQGDHRTRFTSGSLYFSLRAAQVSTGSRCFPVWGVSGGQAQHMPAGAQGEPCRLRSGGLVAPERKWWPKGVSEDAENCWSEPTPAREPPPARKQEAAPCRCCSQNLMLGSGPPPRCLYLGPARSGTGRRGHRPWRVLALCHQLSVQLKTTLPPSGCWPLSPTSPHSPPRPCADLLHPWSLWGLARASSRSSPSFC